MIGIEPQVYYFGGDRWLDVYNVANPAFFDSGFFNYNGPIDRTVANISARNAIPADQRYHGMLVNVTGDGIYELTTGLENFDWAPFTGPFTNVAGLGAVGTIFRFFNFDTGEHVDYEVTSFVNNKSIGVELVAGQDRDIYLVMGTTNATPLKLRNCYKT